MTARTIQLPAGTEHTEIIAIPMNGTWHGLTRVRVSSHTANFTMHEFIFIDVSQNDTKVRYRRVGPPANNRYNNVVKPGQEIGWWAAKSESLLKLTYTSTYPISVIYETLNGGFIAQLVPLPVLQWNKSADAKPWVTNLTLNNPSEKLIPDGTRNAMGLYYWLPR